MAIAQNLPVRLAKLDDAELGRALRRPPFRPGDRGEGEQREGGRHRPAPPHPSQGRPLLQGSHS